ncbi:MAG: hypothetical protein Q4D02_06850 [Clostridia bacterium]|nr:hypothetical protein [Clostridia bacterium]
MIHERIEEVRQKLMNLLFLLAGISGNKLKKVKIVIIFKILGVNVADLLFLLYNDIENSQRVMMEE